MTTYNFDEVIERRNTTASKWDALQHLFGVSDVLAMWVADMDFKSPQPVIDALKTRVEHGIFGYTQRPDSYVEAMCDWMKNRHKWEINKDWIEHSPGVVPSLRLLVETFSDLGDKVIIQPPVYHPFHAVVEMQGREVVENPLQFDGERYTIDFDDLERKAASGAKMLILCSPHNPVGRVWSRDELRRLGDICSRNQVLVIADEIHGDLIYKPYHHIPFASISDAFAMNSITCIAPSKTFNLAGMQTSSLIIPNEEIRKKFHQAAAHYMLGGTSALGVVAAESAYRHGGEWLDELMDYLKANLNLLTETIEARMPAIKVIQAEGTYLVWLDCREMGLDAKALNEFFLHKAKLALNDGVMFGNGGEGFQRINIACPRSVLAQALKQLESAMNTLNPTT